MKLIQEHNRVFLKGGDELVFKNFLKGTLQALSATVLLFFTLESICLIAGVPQGASQFAEKVILAENLSAKKPKGEFRIFAYGESTIYGSHYGLVSSPVRWLEAYLKDFLPGKNIRIVNFGRIGQGSFAVYQTFRDSIAYKPDLAIFYVGHNGFLPGNRKDEINAEQNSLVFQIRQWSQKSRFISLISKQVVKIRVSQKKKSLLDERKAITIEAKPRSINLKYITPRNELFYWENRNFSRHNILNILKWAKKHRIPVLFLRPICNLKDFSPSYSIHMKKLTPEDLTNWESLYEKGKRSQNGNKLKEAIHFYTQAYIIDNTFADLSFRLGQLYWKKGEFREARRFFEEARDNDVLITRANQDTLQYFDELANAGQMNLIETEKVLIPEVPDGILGNPIIEDNVHLSLKGHSLVGRLLAQEIAERDWIAPKKEWHFEKERSYQEIANQLGINKQLLIYAYIEMVNYFGSRYSNRIYFAKKALELEPNNPFALRALAWTYYLMGEQGKAFEIYRKLEQLDPHAFEEVVKIQPRVKEFTAKTEFFKARKRAVTEPLPLI